MLGLLRLVVCRLLLLLLLVMVLMMMVIAISGCCCGQSQLVRKQTCGIDCTIDCDRGLAGCHCCGCCCRYRKCRIAWMMGMVVGMVVTRLVQHLVEIVVCDRIKI